MIDYGISIMSCFSNGMIQRKDIVTDGIRRRSTAYFSMWSLFLGNRHVHVGVDSLLRAFFSHFSVLIFLSFSLYDDAM